MLQRTWERVRRYVPMPLRRQLSALRRGFGAWRERTFGPSYEKRAQREVELFHDDTDVHALPPIFHYWSNKHLRPILEAFGFGYPEDFYALNIARAAREAGRDVDVLSVGAGNADTEIRVARLLAERGVAGVRFICLDLNDAMLARGRNAAKTAGVADRFTFITGDFNRWKPERRYDVIMANQVLHHVVGLERLFKAIAGAMHPHSVFVCSDMIGRNGHLRWPEARPLIDRYWNELPDAYRYNRPLRRHETQFLDWDCATESFEGIRAQDILPLLVKRFGFRFFYAYGNVIDPFIDRVFGPNFDAEAAWDRDFIDRVHAADEAALAAGIVKPTHMLAVMTLDRSAVPEIWGDRTPERCIRRP